MRREGGRGGTKIVQSCSGEGNSEEIQVEEEGRWEGVKEERRDEGD